MLQIQHICKEYRTGTLVQKALDDVSLNCDPGTEWFGKDDVS